MEIPNRLSGGTSRISLQVRVHVSMYGVHKFAHVRRAILVVLASNVVVREVLGEINFSIIGVKRILKAHMVAVSILFGFVCKISGTWFRPVKSVLDYAYVSRWEKLRTAGHCSSNEPFLRSICPKKVIEMVGL